MKKEEKTSFSEKKVNKKVTAKPITSVDAEQNYEDKKYSTVEIALEYEIDF